MWHVDDPHRPTQMSASTDADVRIDRRRCPYRPTQMSVSTDADGFLLLTTNENKRQVTIISLFARRHVPHCRHICRRCDGSLCAARAVAVVVRRFACRCPFVIFAQSPCYSANPHFVWHYGGGWSVAHSLCRASAEVCLFGRRRNV